MIYAGPTESSWRSFDGKSNSILPQSYERYFFTITQYERLFKEWIYACMRTESWTSMSTFALWDYSLQLFACVLPLILPSNVRGHWIIFVLGSKDALLCFEWYCAWYVNFHWLVLAVEVRTLSHDVHIWYPFFQMRFNFIFMIIIVYQTFNDCEEHSHQNGTFKEKSGTVLCSIFPIDIQCRRFFILLKTI